MEISRTMGNENGKVTIPEVEDYPKMSATCFCVRRMSCSHPSQIELTHFSSAHKQVHMWKKCEDKYLLVVMDVSSGGELYQRLLSDRKQYDEPLLWQWASDLAVGVRDIHARNVCHLDLKPQVGMPLCLK